MVAQAGEPDPLQEKVKSRWLRLFTPQPPPGYVPLDAFGAKMTAAIEQRYRDTKTAVDKLRARGGKIVFVRFPASGTLKEHEDKFTLRAKTWDPLLQQTGAPGISLEDFPELASFICPEW